MLRPVGLGRGIGVVCAVVALTAVACKPRNKPPPPTAKNAPPPVKGGALAMLDKDLEDENGDDGDRAPPPKQASARSDAQVSAVTRARLTALDLGKQPVKPPPPPKITVKKDTSGGCGELTLGGKKVRLDCGGEDYGKVKSASKSILSEEEFGGSGPPVKLPPAVDFREKKQVGPVLDQGHTLSCTAVSLAAVVNHELSAKGKSGDVSPLHIWARYANPSMDQAIRTNEGKNIVPMNVFPYDWKVADQWDKTRPPPASEVQKLDGKSVVKITDVMEIAPKDIRGTLAQGHAVWFALAAAHFIHDTAGEPGGPRWVMPYDWQKVPPEQRNMGHALALMGYTTLKSGKVFYLIQNSWGADWGDKGFAYIDEDTFFRNLRGAYSIEVSPTGESKLMGGAPPTKCKPGLLPDAANGKCAAACPDGSARIDGACAEAGECDAGEVNVKGQCVRAAPTVTVKKDNYAIKCVPGGCLYGFKKGTAGCTRENGCVLSCPAPNFKLVNTTSGLRCH
ncbi:MAG: C1 family peptidase [Labilithrix sp.]